MNYFSIDGCPGRFFACERLRANLSTASCADRWKLAQEKGAPDRLAQCRGCKIGAEHAGVELVESNPLYSRNVCTRCHRPADRLIHDELCPSCYNRGREFVLGRNAKGTRPVKTSSLHPVTLRIAAAGRVSDRHSALALDATEAVVAVLRSTPGVVAFAFCPSGVLQAQRGLF